MPRTPTIQIRSINLAAFLEASTGESAAIIHSAGELTTFTFPETAAVREAVLDYEQGAVCEARKLLNTRERLYKSIRNARNGGAL